MDVCMFTTELLVWIGSLNINKQQYFITLLIGWLLKWIELSIEKFCHTFLIYITEFYMI